MTKSREKKEKKQKKEKFLPSRRPARPNEEGELVSASGLRVKDTLPWGIQVAGAWAWRILAICGVAWVMLQLIVKFSMVVIPIAISLLFTAVLMPLVKFLNGKLHLPKGLAAILALLIGTGIASLVLTISISQVATDAPDLATKAAAGFSQLTDWLSKGPLGLQEQQVTNWLNQASAQIVTAVKSNASSIASGAFFAASSIASSMATMITILFCVFFFLKDGKQIWVWCVRLFPRIARRPIHESFAAGWSTVGAWARVQVLVAAIDAVGIGLGAYFVGVSLWVPIALLTFMMGFIPILGAIVAGSVAVLVALVDVGSTAAIIMVVVVLVVQQTEGNVLQPMLMSSAVALHPVAVVLGVAAGGYLAGVTGALFVVPVMAFANEAINRANSAKALENHSNTTDEELGLVLKFEDGEESNEALPA
ncbi:hypothetical protein BSR28_07410 [Boudabousia liubingyangii]|uniref:AI-2E family transporter n=1 Tax=Boudabousia liubingyangii TaxID=1921764 RepID=UPI000938D91E|nr:AI-2E family transporter [Boudabousia liubingyangii]OKL46351.1 hypothetical protein BSR28_07410 [Boudabousia liubingyangii]